MSTVSLQQLGAVLIAPILTFFNQKLTASISDNETLFFLAREGYWFSRAYSEFCKKSGHVDNSQYMLVSRAFLFKIGLLYPKTFPYSLNFKFDGTSYELMRSRFMLSDVSINQVLTDDEQQEKVCLPEDIKKVSALLTNKKSKLSPVIEPSHSAYRQYLTSIDFFKASKVNLVDVGYSGTIQTLLTIMFDINTSGHYLIASNAGTKKIGKQELVMKGYLKEGVKLGEGYIPLDRSMFLEALLTAPVGQFQDIRLSPLPDKNFDMYYGRKVATQQQFHLLEQVCQGAIEQMTQHADNNISFSADEVENLYSTFVTKKGMLPKCSWPLFSIDDDISSEGTVNGLDFFGLKL